MAKWMEVEMNKVARLSTKKKERPKASPLSVREIQGALVAYLVVVAHAIFAFFVEKFMCPRSVRVLERSGALKNGNGI